ncbi:hypothetical protein [Shimazuella kribbensis]|nr:hypothetical protein [Shimazuella kribbensis]
MRNIIAFICNLFGSCGHSHVITVDSALYAVTASIVVYEPLPVNRAC